MSDLREQIIKAIKGPLPTTDIRPSRKLADAVLAKFQPVLDAKDAEIARLKEQLRLTRIEATAADADRDVYRQHADRVEAERDRLKATIARAKALAEGWLADGPADAKILAQRTIATLDQPTSEET